MCVCVCLIFLLWLLACIFSVPPIIPDECAPALLPHRGPVAPQWWGHSDHLLSANCPAAPQDAGELASSRPSVLNLAETPLGYIWGMFYFFSLQLRIDSEKLTVQSITVFFTVSMKQSIWKMTLNRQFVLVSLLKRSLQWNNIFCPCNYEVRDIM